MPISTAEVEGSAFYETDSWVWYKQKDNIDLWKAGRFVKTQANEFVVRALDDHLVQISSSSIRPMHPSSVTSVSDMTLLGDLTESALFFNLYQRFYRDEIYTYTGNILVALNPYKQIEGIYTLENVQRYRNMAPGDYAALPPHIFAIVNEAYSDVIRSNRHQCCVISGLSGSGKTEATKLIIQYLAAMSTERSLVQEQIIEASPILEAFGNAKTIQNNNSSRFGKYIEVQMTPQGTIVGARMQEYLLEKSRIVKQSFEERNYHIFYQLLAGASEEERKSLQLQSTLDFSYLNGSGVCHSIPGVNDAEEFDRLRTAFKLLGFANINDIMTILASVLHLGNIKFAEKAPGVEDIAIADIEVPNFVASLLGLDPEKLKTALTERISITRGEKFISPLNMAQAIDARDALAKALYSRMFSWLVRHINNLIYNSSSSLFNIGVLDIFGFEDFAINSFEQFCINFANERLQAHFNQYIFKAEQDEYDREGVSWEKIEFIDNGTCIDLICKKPTGLIYLLDEESNFPKGTDASLLAKFYTQFDSHPNFKKSTTKRSVFTIHHYAGDVTYLCDGFLEKNRDTFRADLVDLIQSSSNALLVTLFAIDDVSALVSSADRIMTVQRNTRKAPTTSSQFNTSLNGLLNTLSMCNPFFIRCIKPNASKVARKIDDELLLSQLRYTGMLETIRIRKLGFPYRCTITSLIERYSILLKGDYSKDALPNIVQKIMHETDVSEEKWRIGHSKVFMKSEVEAMLEFRRNQSLSKFAILIQKNVRMYFQKQSFKRRKEAIITIQSEFRKVIQRKNYLVSRALLIKLQSIYRGYKQRIVYRQLISERRQKKNVEHQITTTTPKLSEAEQYQKTEKDEPNPEEKTIEPDDNENDDEVDTKLLVYLESTASEREVRAKERTTTKSTAFRPVSFSSFAKYPMDLEMRFSSITLYVLEPKQYPLDNIVVTMPKLERFNSWTAGSIDHGSNFSLQNAKSSVTTSLTKYVRVFLKEGVDLEYSDVPLRESLLKLGAELSAIAVQMNNILIKFLNEESISMQRYLHVINYLVEQIVFHPELCDELFAQLMKASNNSPTDAISDRTWELTAIFSSMSHPSSHMLPFIINFVEENAPDILATMIIERLMQRICRKSYFTSVELLAIMKRESKLLVHSCTVPHKNEPQWVELGHHTKATDLIQLLSCSNAFEMSVYIIDSERKWECYCDSNSYLFDAIAEWEKSNAQIGPAKKNSYQIAPMAVGTIRLNLNTGKLLVGTDDEKLSSAESMTPKSYFIEIRPSFIWPASKLDGQSIEHISMEISRMISIRHFLVAAHPIPADYEKIDPASLIAIALEWPLFFFKCFHIMEQSFPVRNARLCFDRTGISVVDYGTSSIEILSSWKFDEFEIKFVNNTCLHVEVDGRQYAFSCDGTIIAQFFEKFKIEMQNIALYAEAMDDHNANGDSNLLSFKQGDVVLIQDRDYENGWLLGQLENRNGWFPKGLVRLLLNEPKPLELKNGNLEAQESLISKAMEEIKSNVNNVVADEEQQSDKHSETTTSSTLESKFTMLEYAKLYFVEESHLPVSKKSGLFGGTVARMHRVESNVEQQEWSWQSLVSRIKFTRNCIAQPHTKIDDQNSSKFAVETFQLIMSYMGDYPTKKPREQLIIHLVEIILRNMETLKDEIYIQIIRQLTGNKSSKSCERGWVLMKLLVCYVAPSKVLEPYLKHFLNSFKARDYEMDAQESLSRVIRTISYGGKLLAPLKIEIHSLEERQPIRAKFNSPDGTSKMIVIESLTSGKDVVDIIAARYNISNSSLYGVDVPLGGGRMLPIGANTKLFDALATCGTFENTECSLTPIFEFNKRVWDLEYPNETAIIPLHYQMAKQFYLKGMFLGLEELSSNFKPLATELAALIFIADNSAKDVSQLDFSQLIPVELTNLGIRSEWDVFIKGAVKSSLIGKSSNWKQTAQHSFLSKVSSLSAYASAYFNVKAANDARMSSGGVLSIGPKGLRLQDRSNKQLLFSASFDEIVGFRHDEHEFVLRTGDLLSKRILRFQTEDSLAIVTILDAYIQWFIRKKMK